MVTNQSGEKTTGLLFFGSRASLALDTSSICSRDPFRPIRKQQTTNCSPGHPIHMKAYVHGVGTHAQFSEMHRPPKYSPGPLHLYEGISHRPTAHAQTLKTIPRPLTSPEVNEKHTVLEIKSPFFVTPSISFTNPARVPLPPQFSHSRKGN